MEDREAMRVLEWVELLTRKASEGDLATVSRAFELIEKRKGVVMDAIKTATREELRGYVEKVFGLLVGGVQ